MAQETRKANKLRRQLMPMYQKIFKGTILDVGCGDDPISSLDFPAITHVTPFDKEQGNAEQIDAYIHERFDVVYASQFLEHTDDPFDCFRRMLSLVKLGGHLVVSVPDFCLYENGTFPSRWNPDHKWVWGMRKPNHPRGMGFLDLLTSLKHGYFIYAQLCDTNWDYGANPDIDQTQHGAEAWLEGVVRRIA